MPQQDRKRDQVIESSDQQSDGKRAETTDPECMHSKPTDQVGRRFRSFRRIFKIFSAMRPLPRLSATPSEWTSLTQLIQELVGGIVRRNRFTQWELDLLLDLELSRLRKSSRGDALRRYLRTVQASQAQGVDEPPRFSTFLQEIAPRKAAASGGASK
jgi:hypothetical protein